MGYYASTLIRAAPRLLLLCTTAESTPADAHRRKGDVLWGACPPDGADL